MTIMLNALAMTAVAVVTTASIPQQARADRVCRQECTGPVCTEKCAETSDRDRERITVEGRGDRREEKRDERRDREPGVELKVPGVGVEIGH